MRRTTITCILAATLLLATSPTARAEELPPGFTDGEPVGSEDQQTASAPEQQAVTTAAETTERFFGEAPFNAVTTSVAAAPRPSGCTIADHILKAMVLAPVFKESSAATTESTAPAPMTLSRYDEWTGTYSDATNAHANYGLYAFRDPYTAFLRAYWHPGIGIWQYDSAGVGAPFTAIERMHAGTVAADVAKGMASRYCSASGTAQQKRYEAWRPWGYPCTLCEGFWHEMMDISPRLSNITLVSGIQLLGGVRTRSCRVPAFEDPVTCWYVNPSVDVIQGATAWATLSPSGGSGPTVAPAPLSAPFYVVDGGSFEERHWLRDDTGYDRSIAARRVMGENARPRDPTSSGYDGSPGLAWRTPSGLCDLTVGRGDCGPADLEPPQPLGRVDSSRPAGNVPVVGDFDGNGLSDVLWYGAGSNPDELWIGTGLGAFDESSVTVTGSYRPVVARLGPAARADVLWHVPSSGRVAIWRYDGAGGFDRTEHTVPRDTIPLVGDFDGDDLDEVLWYGKGDIADVYWDGTATGIEAVARPVRGAYLPRVGDFDGNGVDDIFWYGPGSKPDSVWMHAEGGSWSQVVLSVIGNYKPAVADFNCDGRSDVLWYAAGPASDTLWLGVDGRSWTARSTPIGGTYTLITADADADSCDELVLYQPGTGSDHYWEFDSAGRVSTTASIRVGGTYHTSAGDFGSPHGGLLWAHTTLGAVTLWTP